MINYWQKTLGVNLSDYSFFIDPFLNKMSAFADIYKGFCHFYWLQSCVRYAVFIVDYQLGKIKILQLIYQT